MLSRFVLGAIVTVVGLWAWGEELWRHANTLSVSERARVMIGRARTARNHYRSKDGR
jgi:hypothetical protein